MKKMIVLIAVLTMVAFAFGAMAQQKTTPAPANPAPLKLEKFSGTIAKVDALAKTFDVKKTVTVKGKKEEKVMTFATDDKTKITKGKETKAFADLKAGMSVSVEYKVEMGKNIAVAVKIAAPKPAPKTGK
jgi:predicted dinucleotide-utilizing enzyme